MAYRARSTCKVYRKVKDHDGLTEAGHRPLRVIAEEIFRTWRPNPVTYKGGISYAALPYARSMLSLRDLSDVDFCDSARDIVLRFLGNAGTWKGEDARRIKAELRSILEG